MQNVTVRRSTSADESALARLAALDSASPPRGPALIAEADTRMLAALPLGAGRPIANPSEPPAALVQLLELRRTQIAAAGTSPPRAQLPRAPPRSPLTRLKRRRATRRAAGGSNQQPLQRTAPVLSLRAGAVSLASGSERAR